MVVQAYVLVQTEVGKAAEVAKAIAAIKGVTLAEDVSDGWAMFALQGGCGRTGALAFDVSDPEARFVVTVGDQVRVTDGDPLDWVRPHARDTGRRRGVSGQRSGC